MALRNHEMTYEDYESQLFRKHMEKCRVAYTKWFNDYKLVSWFMSDFKYWITLTYRSDIDQPLDRCMKDIKHLKNVIHKKLFGYQKFSLDFFPVVETKKEKGFHFVDCKSHFHILVGDLPKEKGPDFIVDSWLKMRVSGDLKHQKICVINKENISEVRGLVDYQLKLKEAGNYDFWDVDSYTKKVSMS